MRQITVRSNAKINLSLEVGAVGLDGMHPVDTIMQKLTLGDEVTVKLLDSSSAEAEGTRIIINTNGANIPEDKSNLAYKAAVLMLKTYGERIPKEVKESGIYIDIKKNIPIAAGLAGGSGNGSQVMRALNELWGLFVSEEELVELSSKLGADVPFCTSSRGAARGRGTGAELSPSVGIKAFVLLAKPDIEVSTPEVYKGIDSCEVRERPNNDELEEALIAKDHTAAARNMINVLENYTLKAKPEVLKLKNHMEECSEGAFKVLMSGSGPTVFSLFENEEELKRAYDRIKALGYTAFMCETVL